MEIKNERKSNLPLWMENCAIVYATEPLGFEASAGMLQAAIEEMTGIRPPVWSEEEANSAPFEILIGRTNRPLSREC